MVVTETSIFQASQQSIWEKLLELSTLQFIAAPFAAFVPVDGESGLVWRAGETFRFRFKLFSLIPLGVHTIRVVRVDKATGSVETVEHNPFVPVWNHRIELEVRDGAATVYTDRVELNAGWMTGLVYVWAKLFYRHRQRKWRQVLRRSDA